jgi:hypothetical protein
VFELEAVSAITTQKGKKTKTQQTNTINAQTDWGLYAQKRALRLVLSRHRPYTAGNALLSIGPAYRAFVAQAALRQRR